VPNTQEKFDYAVSAQREDALAPATAMCLAPGGITHASSFAMSHGCTSTIPSNRNDRRASQNSGNAKDTAYSESNSHRGPSLKSSFDHSRRPQSTMVPSSRSCKGFLQLVQPNAASTTSDHNARDIYHDIPVRRPTSTGDREGTV